MIPTWLRLPLAEAQAAVVFWIESKVHVEIAGFFKPGGDK